MEADASPLPAGLPIPAESHPAGAAAPSSCSVVVAADAAGGRATMFRRPVTIRFDQADPAGVLFYARVLELAHHLYEEFVSAELGVPWAEWFLDPSRAVPIRRAEAVYHRPLRPGRTYDAELRITALGESSFEATTRFLDREDAATCAETRVTHVFADLPRGRKLAIPSEVKSRLAAHLES